MEMKRMCIGAISIRIEPIFTRTESNRKRIEVVIQITIIKADIGLDWSNDQFSVSFHTRNGELYITIGSCIKGKNLLDLSIVSAIKTPFITFRVQRSLFERC